MLHNQAVRAHLAPVAQRMRRIGTASRAPQRDAEEYFVERVGKRVRRFGEGRGLQRSEGLALVVGVAVCV